MATKKRTPRKQSSAGTSKKAVSGERKKEILGLILMVLASLVSLALVTYSQADEDLVSAFDVDAFLQPGRDAARNALGLLGAHLARALVPGLLGYASLLLTGLLFAWGYVVFRRKKTVYLPQLTVMIVVGAVVLAALLGWFGVSLPWSGAVGAGLAGWMQRVFGAVGALVLLLLLATVTILLVIDHDIQQSLDRVERAFVSLRDRLRAWRTTQKERHTARRAERERRRREREAEAKRHARAPEPERGTAPPARETPPSRPVPAPRTRAPIPELPPEIATPPSPRLNDLFRDPPSEPQALRPVEAPPVDLTLKIRERVEEERADAIEHDVEAADPAVPYEYPAIDLLDDADADGGSIDFDELETNKRILLDKLAMYNIEIVDINAVVGPTVTLYELAPAPGVKISRITALEDDLAMAMAARGIRMIAPIPGKSAIGVEIPNRNRELVRIRDVLGTARFRDAEMELPIALGKSIEGEVFLQDLVKMPHLLIAGATGSGKSVGLNALIAGLLYKCHPSNLKFVMIDPKKIELQQYKALIDHYLAMPDDGEDEIITDFNDALGVFKSCEREMERRYDMLSRASVRSIRDYNRKLKDNELEPDGAHRHLPYIVVIVDELADLIMTAGKEIEGPIARLAQMSRAVGIHLVLATQRPSVDVITGLIKANFPSRVAYQVASKIDSRTILDQNGAEGLVGNGDLLFMTGSRLLRLQGPFVSIDEVDRLMDFISGQVGPGPYVLPPSQSPDDGGDFEHLGLDERDDLFDEAARIIVRSQQGSVSLLQRKLSVGYTRAARIVDQLEEAGIVGPFVGSKARDVLVPDEMHLDALLKASPDD